MYYDKESKTFHITSWGSWIIMGLATVGIINIVMFFIEVNKVH